MNSRIFLGLVLHVACRMALQAAEVAELPPYVLKNKSAFTPMNEEERAPFWPIGWVKNKPVLVTTDTVRTVAVPKVVLDRRSFKVTSILLGNPSLAIINGRTYSEGEFLRMPKAASAETLPAGVRVRVFRINDGAVVLQNQEQLITVALLRPGLLQRRDDEVLLIEDRP